MNKIVLLGKLIRDPELRLVEGTDKNFTKFILAVERGFKSINGERKSDLIPITMWGKKSEVACKFLKKGSTITLSGRLQTKSYQDEQGNKKYVTQVIAEDFRFVNTRNNFNSSEQVVGNK